MSTLTETLAHIRTHYTGPAPKVGIILGTGMGKLAAAMEPDAVLPYNFIPHFPISTVESHLGRLLLGTLEGVPVVVMQGRFHYYEGYDLQQVTYPVRVMKLLGADTLLVSNAAGGINPAYTPGDLMLLDDHINFLPDNPLRGPNDPNLGPRFPDLSAPYDAELMAVAKDMAPQAGATIHQGVYVAVPGPNLETRAEYRMLRTMGADAVGMSTVPEVIVANHMGMRVLAISVITDACDPDNLKPLTLEEVVAVASTAEPKLTQIMRGVLRHLAKA